MVRSIRLAMIVKTIVKGPTHSSLRRATCSRSRKVAIVYSFFFSISDCSIVSLMRDAKACKRGDVILALYILTSP